MADWRDEFGDCPGGDCSPREPCCDACAEHDECHQDWSDEYVAEAKQSQGGTDG